MLTGTWLSGKLADSYYRKIREEMIRQARSDSEKDIDPKAVEKDPTFPIERARLQILPCIMFIYTASVIGYGWSLQSRVTIAAPLILQIISKFVSCTALNGLASHHLSFSWHNSYHYNERHPDSVSRPGARPWILYHRNNIVRCSLGAGMVSIINPILVVLSNGWTYTLLGGLCVLISPLLYVEIRWGPVWRERRRKKQEALHRQ